MDIEIKLTRDHWNEFNRFVNKLRAKQINILFGSFWLNLIAWCVLVLIIMILYGLTKRRIDAPTAELLFFIFFILFMFFALVLYKHIKALAPSEKGLLLGTHYFIFDEKGIHSKGKGYESFHQWSTVIDIEVSKKLVILFLDTIYAFIIPIDQLDDHKSFLDEIEILRNKYLLIKP